MPATSGDHSRLVRRLEHIGVVVDDLDGAKALSIALGLEVEGEASVEGRLVDRIIRLEGVSADIVILRTPDDSSKLELAEYRSPSYESGDEPAPPNHRRAGREDRLMDIP